MRRAAVIAIGSNSTRMLAANLDDRLTARVRGREETGLFLRLDGRMAMGGDALDAVRKAVLSLQRQALAAGAGETHLIATSAVRDAGDAGALRDALEQDTGLVMRVVSGEEEARYSFLGAACAFPEGTRLGVADIGGGSTEIAAGTPAGPEYLHSAQMGAARLFRARPIHTPADVRGAVSEAGRALESLPALPQPPPREWVLVGGTGAALIGLLRGALMDADAEGDEPFARGDALRVMRLLAGLDRERRAALPGMTRGREDILPTGLAVLAALMKRLGIRHMAVTARNNTDGFLYALHRARRGSA